MDQDVLRQASAGMSAVMIAGMLGRSVFLRLRGVAAHAVGQGKSNRVQRVLVIGAGVILVYVIGRAYFPVLDMWLGARPSPAPQLSLAAMIFGAVIMLISQWGMSGSWRVGVPETDGHVEALVTGGMHRFSRNPFYLGVMIYLTGVLLAAPGPLTAAGVFVAFVGLNIIIRQEEKYLEHRFGADYAAYKKRVRRWI